MVVLVITILAAASGGIFIGTYKNMLVKKSARDFLLAAKYARIIAVEHQRPCRIEIDTANNRFWLALDRYNEETGETEAIIIRDLYTKPLEFDSSVEFEGVVVESNTPDEAPARQNTINFSVDGTAEAAIVQIGDGDNHYTISISAATGRAKIFPETADKIKAGTIDLDAE